MQRVQQGVVARVKCGCGWWIDVPGEGIVKQCWKCNGEVYFTHTGNHLQGKTKQFMKFDWQDTPAQQVYA